MKHLAAEGRTVFVSSHLMNEMSLTADHLIVIGRGRLLADCSAAEFVDRHSRQQVLVKSTDRGPARPDAGPSEGGHVTPGETGALTVTGVTGAADRELAAWARLVIHELTPQRASLEEGLMEMTADSQEFGGRGTRCLPQPPGRHAMTTTALPARPDLAPAVRDLRLHPAAPLGVDEAPLGPVHRLVARGPGGGRCRPQYP